MLRAMAWRTPLTCRNRRRRCCALYVRRHPVSEFTSDKHLRRLRIMPKDASSLYYRIAVLAANVHTVGEDVVKGEAEMLLAVARTVRPESKGRLLVQHLSGFLHQEGDRAADVTQLDRALEVLVGHGGAEPALLFSMQADLAELEECFIPDLCGALGRVAADRTAYEDLLTSGQLQNPGSKSILEVSHVVAGIAEELRRDLKGFEDIDAVSEKVMKLQLSAAMRTSALCARITNAARFWSFLRTPPIERDLQSAVDDEAPLLSRAVSGTWGGLPGLHAEIAAACEATDDGWVWLVVDRAARRMQGRGDVRRHDTVVAEQDRLYLPLVDDGDADTNALNFLVRTATAGATLRVVTLDAGVCPLSRHFFPVFGLDRGACGRAAHCSTLATNFMRCLDWGRCEFQLRCAVYHRLMGTSRSAERLRETLLGDESARHLLWLERTAEPLQPPLWQQLGSALRADARLGWPIDALRELSGCDIGPESEAEPSTELVRLGGTPMDVTLSVAEHMVAAEREAHMEPRQPAPTLRQATAKPTAADEEFDPTELAQEEDDEIGWQGAAGAAAWPSLDDEPLDAGEEGGTLRTTELSDDDDAADVSADEPASDAGSGAGPGGLDAGPAGLDAALDAALDAGSGAGGGLGGPHGSGADAAPCAGPSRRAPPEQAAAAPKPPARDQLHPPARVESEPPARCSADVARRPLTVIAVAAALRYEPALDWSLWTKNAPELSKMPREAMHPKTMAKQRVASHASRVGKVSVECPWDHRGPAPRPPDVVNRQTRRPPTQSLRSPPPPAGAAAAAAAAPVSTNAPGSAGAAAPVPPSMPQQETEPPRSPELRPPEDPVLMAQATFAGPSGTAEPSEVGCSEVEPSGAADCGGTLVGEPRTQPTRAPPAEIQPVVVQGPAHRPFSFWDETAGTSAVDRALQASDVEPPAAQPRRQAAQNLTPNRWAEMLRELRLGIGARDAKSVEHLLRQTQRLTEKLLPTEVERSRLRALLQRANSAFPQLSTVVASVAYLLGDQDDF
eukprot:TRINITY_DN21251_c0_g1_i1.p1 TRINITY_DN21251_c0_g1~~TRINITY_DN21251_c0_g1_i1.p1  ORF type:complete len:1019 (+),score=225.71 TRINITY_DN21251_c0_g1_i1:80-3136(+)